MAFAINSTFNSFDSLSSDSQITHDTHEAHQAHEAHNIDDSLYAPEYDHTKLSSSNTLRKGFYDFNSRKVKSHTLRKGFYDFNSRKVKRPTVFVKRFANSGETGIPVTDVDILDKRRLLVHDITNYSDHYYPIYDQLDGRPLNSSKFYLDFVDAVLDAATKKKETIDPIHGSIKTEYTVPVIGHMIHHPKVRMIRPTKDYNFVQDTTLHDDVGEKTTHVLENNKYNRQKHRNYVRYNGQLYDLSRFYRKEGATLIPINYPFGHGPSHHSIWQECHVVRIDKTVRRSDCLIFNFHRDQTFCGLRLHPEKMIFDRVHCDDHYQSRSCGKMKHHLSILKTDPGYVGAFELAYRSSTIREWIPIGKFTGSMNDTEIVDISFDEISASEFKFTPINYHKSFSKIICNFFSIGEDDTVSAEDEVVYSIIAPRNGTYFSPESKFPDTFKGQKKSRHSKHRYIAHRNNDRAKNRRDIASIITDSM